MRPRWPSLTSMWGWYLAVGAVLTVLYAAVPPFAGNGPLINLLGLSSSVAIVVGIKVHKPRAKAAWWLFAVGQFLYFLGDVYTYSYPRLFHADVPFPSFGDALYITVYPALMAGLVVLVRRRNRRGDPTGALDGAILTVGIALLSWVFLISPYIHVSGMSVLAKGVSMAYPLGDVLLLAGAIRLAVDAGKRQAAFYLLASSIVCLLTTDSAYTFLLLKNAYTHQVILDAGWIGYLLLWGAAALHPSMRTLEEPAVDYQPRLSRLRLALLMGACLIAPGIWVSEQLRDPGIVVVTCASAVLFVLVVARMAGLVRQQERTTSRERALRRAGVALVGAASREQIYEAGMVGVTSLAGPGTGVEVVMKERNELRVVASTDAGDGALRTLTAEVGSWLSWTCREGVAAATLGPGSSVPPELRLGASTGTLVALPLSVRGEARGFLVAVLPMGDPWSLSGPLEALAAQVSLAVEGATLAEGLHRRKSEARFRSLVAHASDLITVLDASGEISYVSPSVERILGLRTDEVVGTPFQELVSDADRPRLAHVLSEASVTEVETRTIECSLRHRDGTWLDFEVHHTNLLQDEDVRGIVLNGRDISERKAFENQLAHQAFHDPVTELANRALFANRVEHALARAARERCPLGVMFIDLDDFKTVNDSLGHAAGDAVLVEVARRLRGALRPTDTAARFGGDEFAVLLEDVADSQTVADAAERLLQALQAPLDVEGKDIYVRASIGICLCDGIGATEAEELLRNADVAMYMAKRDLKGSYRVFEPAMHESVLERLELRADLQRAIDASQLEVHYQPVVRLNRDASVYGFEALLRWYHPTRGPISPMQFIPLAEETGLIVPVGRWVLAESCRTAVALQERFPTPEGLCMSVNLSVKQLQSETVYADVRDALEGSGLRPENLVLEITESVMMADTDLAVERLRSLKDLGVRLAMDDFGTGYSSLSYLSRFPVDILKMDRSFLQAGHYESGFAAAILALGDTLDLDVVAEGIELPNQADALRALGCDLGQGFLFAPAMPWATALEYLQDGLGTSTDEPQADAA
jgi:diguanylate cyclase (GGDEF)-like protein/PAS domain S-box-containing protein